MPLLSSPCETARLATLRSLSVLDTLPEAETDGIVQVASALFDVPIALISLLDEDRQWFKAKLGVELCETSRDVSFCAHAINGPEPLVVEDARTDPRFRDNPFVAGEAGIRFYAGAPILVDGHAVGTVCVLDVLPRTPTEQQVKALTALAGQATALLKARRNAATFQEGERRFVAFLDNAPGVAFLKDAEGRMRFVNTSFERFFGKSMSEVLGKTDHDWLPQAFADGCARDDARVRATGRPMQFEETALSAKGEERQWRTTKFPFETEDGTWIGGIVVDITEQRNAERRIHEQNAELARALQEAETSRASAQIAAARFSQLFDGLPVACFCYGEGGSIHEWNAAAEQLWGITAEDALLASIYDTVVGPENREHKEAIVARVFAGETVHGVERREKMRDGREVWLLTSTFPLRTPNGAIVGAVSANVDVTERKRAEEALRASEARMRTVIDSLHEGVVVQDVRGKVRLWNRSTERILGIPGERMDLGSEDDPRRHATREDGSDFPPSERPFAVAIREGRPAEAVLSYMHPALGKRWLSLMASPLEDGTGEPVDKAVVSFLDVTARREAEAALRDSEARFRSVVASLQEGLLLQDADGRIIVWNESAERILGVTGDDIRDRHALDPRWRPVHENGRSYEHHERPGTRALQTGEPQGPVIMGIHRPNGELRWLSVNAAPVTFNENGQPTAAVSSFEDVTERVAQERLVLEQMAQISSYSAELELQKLELESANLRLESLASTDGLTGLPNHRTFQDFLRRKLDLCVASDLPLSVVLLDVDRFKQYNDDFGHQAGDAVLRGVAESIASSVRGTDLAARYGGEEFVLVLPGLDAEGALAVAERARARLEAAAFEHRQVTGSFGVATMNGVWVDAESLIRAADEALYRSKHEGRNQVTHADTLRSSIPA